ncbi:4-amino-4-deoxy-L-arabinose transferase [Lutibacter oceani]|uniref:4-amino-4-deoxy-L-arabinose transferase n=1 Tax=Lutibacter oceani TaxID=1853311 RepID=A0A3D9RQG6_9FLAO|nr:glycosyltransferase family 39 protein [Lutibacter oceani]REE79931.1 4-amino-4-deoxy-L-arabinose transferase [Lutibacter oceani]
MKSKLYILLGILFLLLIFKLGNWGLTESSEARYAEIAREMVVSGDYINPTLLGIKHLHKPPVTYYLTALGYKIFGINEFGARFFMQLALVLQLVLVFKITLQLFKSEKIALAALLIYFSFPITIIAVRTLTTDAYLTTFILASIYFWLQYKSNLKPYNLYLFYFFLALIFETKGPVGFMIPVTFVVTHKILNKEKIEFNMHQYLGFILFLFVSSAWYIIVMYKNDGLFDYFINNQLVERVTKNNFKRGKPFWYYLFLMPLIGMPWLFYFVFYFKKNIKNIIQHKKTDFLLIITFLTLFILLSISTSKLILYVLPLYFILAIFSARYLSLCSEKTIKKISNLYFILIIIVTSGFFIASFLNLELKINRIYAFIILVVFSVFGAISNNKIVNTNFIKPAFLGALFIISIIISSNYIFSKNELKINSVKPLAEFIKNDSQSENEVLIYNYLLPSLSFYLNKNITTINHGKYTTTREVQFETTDVWKKNLINYFDPNERERLLKISNSKPTYLIKRKKDVFPDTLKVLVKTLNRKKNFDKFEVYY